MNLKPALIVFTILIFVSIKAQSAPDPTKMTCAEVQKSEALKDFDFESYLFQKVDEVELKYTGKQTGELRETLKHNRDDPNIDCAFSDYTFVILMGACHAKPRSENKNFDRQVEKAIVRFFSLERTYRYNQ